jgi:hypothetical protein
MPALAFEASPVIAIQLIYAAYFQALEMPKSITLTLSKQDSS